MEANGKSSIDVYRARLAAVGVREKGFVCLNVDSFEIELQRGIQRTENARTFTNRRTVRSGQSRTHAVPSAR